MSHLLLLCLVAFFGALIFAIVVGSWKDAFVEAWKQAPAPLVNAPAQRISLIVPARDTMGTLPLLLQDLHAQQWPKELMEVLVVDDGSSDGTADVVRGMMRAWPRLRLIIAKGEGKKAAISQGVTEAEGEWILLTDADARCGPLRVQRVMQKVREAEVDMLLLPVETRGDGGIIQRVQADEQAALLGVTAGTALAGTPVLANGANIAFSKEAFIAVGGYEGDRWASGDDIFLLHRMRKAGKKIDYLLDPETVVTVQVEPTFSAFWQQRLRWAGKMPGVGGAGVWAALAGVVLPWFLLYVSCSFSAKALMAQNPIGCFLLLAVAWLLWWFPVLSLTRTVRSFLRSAGNEQGGRGAGFSTLISLMAFSIYAPIIAVVSLFVRPKWKGRRV